MFLRKYLIYVFIKQLLNSLLNVLLRGLKERPPRPLLNVLLRGLKERPLLDPY